MRWSGPSAWPLAFVALTSACSSPSPPAIAASASSAALMTSAPASASAAPASAAPASAAPASAKEITSAAVEIEAPCRAPDRDGVTLFTAPRSPRAGAPLRVLALSERPLEASLSIRDPRGAEAAGSRDRHGGPPYFWYAEIPAPSAGAHRISLRTRNAATCLDLTVAAAAKPDKARPTGAAWPARAAWDRAAEALYSAWIERLFDAPLGEQLAWPALHEVLRDPSRNLLHDYRGEGEDDAGPKALVIEPDCADLPYFLRAYFAFKLGLPFGFSSCTRGGGGQPPRCLRYHHNLEPAPQRSTPASTFGDFLRVKLADTVHSGTGRTPADHDEGDYYPVPISIESLRPGTIYADPYGHVLVIAKRIPQSEAAGGVLLAVDGQPDGTVSRRRFWRGNFLFAVDPALGSAGWKRFRPVVIDGPGRARSLSNREISAHPDYGDLSLTQYERGVEGFYDAMDDALSPSPLDPTRALAEVIAALEEQVKGRVLSVGNAKKHFAAGGGRIDMPDGAAIFETTGPWEDFSTPSRDLRLLIAVDVVRGLPDRIARRPERFTMPKEKSVAEVKADLEKKLSEALSVRKFTYERSDGSQQELSLAEVVLRAEALEMAYNPNDCPEVRWGAAAGSAEIATCRRRAPGSQERKMRKHRAWFHERRRPPRG